MMLYSYIILLVNVALIQSHCNSPNLTFCNYCTEEQLDCVRADKEYTAGFSDLQEYGQHHSRLKYVVFSGSNLPVLGNYVLGNTSHSSLRSLNLSNNNIGWIEESAFHKMASLKHLVLDNNDWSFDKSDMNTSVFSNNTLTSLSLNGAFSTTPSSSQHKVDMLQLLFVNTSMASLQFLDLSNNGIPLELPSGIFDEMPNLEVFDLSHNKLYRVGVSLSHLTKLKSLKLDHNYMYLVNDSLLEDISSLSSLGSLHNVTLSGNPFECDCNTHKFSEWLHKHTDVVVDASGIKCASSYNSDLIGTPLLDIKEEDLVCDDPLKTSQSYVVLAVVMGLVGLVAVIVIILNRSFFINKYLACKETMGSKHNYTIYGAQYSSVV